MPTWIHRVKMASRRVGVVTTRQHGFEVYRDATTTSAHLLPCRCTGVCNSPLAMSTHTDRVGTTRTVLTCGGHAGTVERRLDMLPPYRHTCHPCRHGSGWKWQATVLICMTVSACPGGRADIHRRVEMAQPVPACPPRVDVHAPRVDAGVCRHARRACRRGEGMPARIDRRVNMVPWSHASYPCRHTVAVPTHSLSVSTQRGPTIDYSLALRPSPTRRPLHTKLETAAARITGVFLCI